MVTRLFLAPLLVLLLFSVSDANSFTSNGVFLWSQLSSKAVVSNANSQVLERSQSAARTAEPEDKNPQQKATTAIPPSLKGETPRLLLIQSTLIHLSHCCWQSRTTSCQNHSWYRALKSYINVIRMWGLATPPTHRRQRKPWSREKSRETGARREST